MKVIDLKWDAYFPLVHIVLTQHISISSDDSCLIFHQWKILSSDFVKTYFFLNILKIFC